MFGHRGGRKGGKGVRFRAQPPFYGPSSPSVQSPARGGGVGPSANTPEAEQRDVGPVSDLDELLKRICHVGHLEQFSATAQALTQANILLNEKREVCEVKLQHETPGATK